MEIYQVINVSQNIVILNNVKVADRFFSRLKGLLGKKKLLERRTAY